MALGVGRHRFLVFEQAERGPNEELRLQFEVIGRLTTTRMAVVSEVIDGMIIKYQTRRWDSARSAATAAAAEKKGRPEEAAPQRERAPPALPDKPRAREVTKP